MEVTSKAKASYTLDDLVSRGRTLILESVKYGVTAMRAHVEVDVTARFKCVDAGLRLKEELKHLCDVGLAGKLFHLEVAALSLRFFLRP